MWRKPPACVCGAASRSPVLPDEARDPHQGAAIRHAVARSETGHSRDRPQRGASLGPVSLACLFGLTVPAHGGSVGDRPQHGSVRRPATAGASLGPVSLACLFGPTVPAHGWLGRPALA
jgi:hypothetical protein